MWNWDLWSWYNRQSARLDVTAACTNAKYSLKEKKEAKVTADGTVNAALTGFEPKFKTLALSLKTLRYSINAKNMGEIWRKNQYFSKHQTAFQIIRQEKLSRLNS